MSRQPSDYEMNTLTIKPQPFNRGLNKDNSRLNNLITSANWKLVEVTFNAKGFFMKMLLIIHDSDGSKILTTKDPNGWGSAILFYDPFENWRREKVYFFWLQFSSTSTAWKTCHYKTFFFEKKKFFENSFFFQNSLTSLEFLLFSRHLSHVTRNMGARWIVERQKLSTW